MGARIYYDSDASLEPLRDASIAVLGYGSQGRAHALNLRDSGMHVTVGLRKDSSSWERAERDGVHAATVVEACGHADLVAMLLPDPSQPGVYRDYVEPNLEPGATLLFAHGFNVHFNQVRAPQECDVVMVAPKSPGPLVRRTYEEGSGTPALLAVHQDASGAATDKALAYARGLGCTRAGVLATTFAEETETDLFGEQAVLCGGVSRLVQAGFETLVRAGYLYEGGFGGMRAAVSDTAEYGVLTRGPRVVGPEVEAALERILEDVRSGAFAKEWVLENEAGRPVKEAERRRQAEHPIEEVGARLRGMMPWTRR